MSDLRSLPLTGVALVPICLLALAPAPAGQEPAAQQPSRDATGALAKTRALLADRPGHAALFNRYFVQLVEANRVEEEIKSYQRRVSGESVDPADALLLGRLLLRTGREEQALEALSSAASTPEVEGILGDIYLELARYDSAARAFRAALPGARTAEAKRVLYEKLGKSLLAQARKDEAIETWRKIGELDGGAWLRRLRVAELFAEAGLLAEAAAEYVPLLADTADDPPRHCRVLRDYGRLQELQGELDAAQRTYDRVLELTGRGNWLRKEVEQRIVQLHRRTGELEALVERLEQQLSHNPSDLATTELLAGVLTEMRELERAAQVLTEASPRFPRDTRLARHLAELQIERGDVDAAIAEYQRILTERPDDLELYLELGTLFARDERFAEARNQWEKALSHNLEDASLCSRIASMYATWDRHDDAIRLYRRAVELEPAAMNRRVDLADLLFARGRKEEGVEVLDRALADAATHPRRLEALVGSLREHRLWERATGCLEQIHAAEPDNNEIRYALGDLLLTTGELERARALLWEVVEHDGRASGYREMAANTLIQLAVRGGQVAELVAEASERGSPGAAFLLGRAHSRQRDFASAIAAYRRAVEAAPSDVASRRLLARLLAEQGDYENALAEYEKLAQIAPSEFRSHFREVAQLHLELYDIESAIDVWRRVMRDHPDNAAVFLRVGVEFLEIQRVQDALEALRQAARLKPGDPDIALRLADALQQSGKSEEAEARLLEVAGQALDARDRDQARARLFDLYSEQALIDDKIAALRAAMLENPYDLEAPRLLADLYNRTGDFVLGLEMVDKALHFQPRNRELLIRRVELLESLEEWDQARTVHEELLKFPGADRDRHLAGVGRALYETGRAEEAKAAFRKIVDRGKVSRLYKKYKLHDEAIEFYRRAIARNPGDVRSYVALADELTQRQRAEDAVEALERALNLRPYHRRALELAGKLYVQVGRRDDAIRVGMRLFGLRGEEEEKTRREKWDEEKERRSRSYYYRSTRRQRSFSEQRLQSAQTYFNSRGLNAEWGAILVAEARRRPTDLVLFRAVRDHYRWSEKSAAKFAAFATELLDPDIDPARGRVPPGYTRDSYRQMIEEALVETWRQDASVAEARLAELPRERCSTAELLERAVLNQALGKLDAAVADLDTAFGVVPADPVGLTLRAERRLASRDYAGAIESLQRLAAWWNDADPQRGGMRWDRDELTARRHAAMRAARRKMLEELPRRMRRTVDDEQLLAVRSATEAPAFKDLKCFRFPAAVPSRPAVLIKLVRLHRAAGDEPGLAAAVDAAIAGCAALAERAELGLVLFQEGLPDAAMPILQSVLDDGNTLKSDPAEMPFWRHYFPVMRTAAAPLGEILAARGQTVPAYRVLLEHGHGEKAELVLRESGAEQRLRDGLTAELDAARQHLVEKRAETSLATVLQTLELDYRDAVIKLADFELGEKDFARAEAVYRDSLDLLRDDIQIRGVIAALQLRRGAHDEAIATHEDIIAVKRRRRRSLGGDTTVPPTRLTPTAPGVSRTTMARVPSLSSSARRRQFDVSTDYGKILQILAKRREHQQLLDTLRKIMREDPATFRRMSRQVLTTLRSQDLGRRKLPILRILNGVVGSDDWLTIEYAKACREEDELEEARRTLNKFIASKVGSTGDYYVTRAEKELDKIRQKLGEEKETVADLRANVDAEPDNVRHRMKLAKRLEKDKDYRGCLAEAREVVRLAPYMTKAKELVVQSAAAAGEDDVAVAMMRRLYEESSGTSDKIRRGVNLANWLYAADAHDEAVGIVDGLELESGGSGSYSPGNWFLDKNRVDDAIRHYLRELEKAKGQQWRQDDIRRRLSRLELATGDAVTAIERHLSSLREAGSLSDREQRFRSLLTVIKGHPDPALLATALQSEYGGGRRAEDDLVMAALAFARGDVPAAEEALRSAVGRSSKEVYLFPLLLGLRKLYGDHDAALAVLDEMSAVYGGSDAMRWSSGVSMTERDRLKIERARILEAMGRGDEVDALIGSIADATLPETLNTLATIYENRRDLAAAFEWYQRYLRKLGTKTKSHLLREARFLGALGRDDEALQRVREAYSMARGDNRTRSTLIGLYRNARRLDEFVTELEQDYARDPRDSGVRSSLISLYRELRRYDDAEAIYRAMLGEEDLIDSALSGLVSLSSERGDDDGHFEFLRRQLERKAGDQKKNIQTKIADLHAVRGEFEAAEAIYREAVELDTAQGQWVLGSWLARHQQWAHAHDAFATVLELDPDHEEVRLPAARAAWRLRKFESAADHLLAYLRRRRGREDLLTPEVVTILLDAVAGLPDATREAWLGGGDTADDLERAALVHLVRGSTEDAIAMAKAAIDKDDDRIIAREVLAEALRRAERRPELLEAIEDLRVRVEREYVVTSNNTYYNRAQKLQDELGRVAHAAGDAAAAERHWLTSPVRRTPYSNPFGYWRSDWSMRYAAEHWMKARRPERALRALEREFLMRETAPWSTRLRALELTGDAAQVAEFAWRRLLDPLELYGVQSGSYGYIWENGTYRRAGGMQEFLVEFYRRHGKLDELRARAEQLRQRPETRRQASELLDALARLIGDRSARAARETEQVLASGRAINRTDRYKLVTLTAEAGDWPAARKHLELLLDFESPGLRSWVPGAATESARSYIETDNEAGNPFTFSFGGNSSYWNWESSPNLDDCRMTAAALLIATGDADRAREIERDLLEHGSRKRRKDRSKKLAEHYRKYGAPTQAARLTRQLLEATDLGVTPKERAALEQNTLDALRRANDAAALREAREWLRGDLEKRIAAEPGPHALELRKKLVALLLDELRDGEAGLREADFLLRFTPGDPDLGARRARALYLIGRADGAVAAFRELSERRRLLGVEDPPAEQAGLGLALIAAGETGPGGKLLRQAQPKLPPDSTLALEVADAIRPR